MACYALALWIPPQFFRNSLQVGILARQSNRRGVISDFVPSFKQYDVRTIMSAVADKAVMPHTIQFSPHEKSRYGSCDVQMLRREERLIELIRLQTKFWQTSFDVGNCRSELHPRPR